MRNVDFVLTFETYSTEESDRVSALYMQIKKALGNPDRIALGIEHERNEIPGEIGVIDITGKQTHTIHVYESEKINRKRT